MEQFEKIRTIGRGSYGSAILVRARRSSLAGDAVPNVVAQRLYVIKEIQLNAGDIEAAHAATTAAARAPDGEGQEQEPQRSRAQTQLSAAAGGAAAGAGSTASSSISAAAAPPSVSPALLNEVQILMRVGGDGHPNVCRYRGSFLISSDSSPQHAAAAAHSSSASSSTDDRLFAAKVARNDVLCLCLDYYAGGDLSRRIKSRVREIARAAGAGAASTSSSLQSSAVSIGGGGGGAGSSAAPSPSSSSKPSSDLCFSESVLLDWFVQLCLGLKHCHDRSILHRDLKTSNVFISLERARSFHAAAATRATAEGEAGAVVEVLRIGDFGIARLLDPGGLARTRIGTPYFLSPEVCEGLSYSQKADVWALGCILFELATGQHVFQASNLNGLVLAILRGVWSVPLPAAYSPRISLLLQSMLQRRPEHRPTVTQLLSIPFLRERIPHWLSHRRILQEFGGELAAQPEFHLPGWTSDALVREARLALASSATRSSRITSSSAPVSPAAAHSSALSSRSVAAGPPSSLRYPSASSSVAIADPARFPSASSSAIFSRIGQLPMRDPFLHRQPLTPQPPSRSLGARGLAPPPPAESSHLRASGLSSSGQSSGHGSSRTGTGASTPSPLPALRSRPLNLAPVPFAAAAAPPVAEPVDAPAPSHAPPSVSASSWTLIERVDRELASLPPAQPAASVPPSAPAAEPLVSVPSSDPSFRWHLPSSLAVATGVVAAAPSVAAVSSHSPAAPAAVPSLSLQCEQVRAYLEERIPMRTLKEAYRIMCARTQQQRGAGTTAEGAVDGSRLETAQSAESQMLRLLQLSQTHLISLLQQLVEAERAQGGHNGAGHAMD